MSPAQIEDQLRREVVARAIKDDVVQWEAGFNLQASLTQHASRDALKALRFAHTDQFSAAIAHLVHDRHDAFLEAVGGAPPRKTAAPVRAAPAPIDPFGATPAPVSSAPPEFIL